MPWRCTGTCAGGCPDTRRECHLGGVLYLFVRGMCGPQTPLVGGAPCGVFGWAPPAALVVELSDCCWTGRVVTARESRRRRPIRATSGWRARPPGCCATFNKAGVLDPADVHVAVRVARLGGETDETVLLAVALAVRAVRLGSVCVDLAAVSRTVLGEGDELVDVSALPWPEPGSWLAACTAGPLVADGADAPPGRPLRLVDGLLYLDRYWGEEEVVRRSLAERAATGLPRSTSGACGRGWTGCSPRPARSGSGSRQRSAALRRVTVLAGGPGTGKTTTVARLLALLHDQPGPPPRVALAAPTGKAAARLQEAVAARAATGAAGEGAGRGHPAPAAGLAARAAAGSATTARSGSRSTWWWSTRRRWCR